MPFPVACRTRPGVKPVSIGVMREEQERGTKDADADVRPDAVRRIGEMTGVGTGKSFGVAEGDVDANALRAVGATEA